VTGANRERAVAGVVLAASLLVVVGCNQEGNVAVTPGEWGGRNVDLVVTDVGASATFKCGAVGRLTGPLMVDDTGHFSAAGTYEPKLVLGGPRPALYSGTLSGSHLALGVQIGSDTPQQFDLTLGQAGSFEPCNY